MPTTPAWTAVPADTRPEAYDVQTEAYRRMGARGRTAVVFRLIEMARRNAMAGIRERHPDYDAVQARRAYARLVLGDDLTRAIWPEHPLVAP